MKGKWLIAVVTLGSALAAHAESAGFNIHATNRLIVVSAKEAVHYAEAPAFVTMKRLIIETVSGTPDLGSASSHEPQYTIRLLSEGKERTYSLGAGWLKGPEGRFTIKPTDFKKMMHIIESRAGEGEPL